MSWSSCLACTPNCSQSSAANETMWITWLYLESLTATSFHPLSFISCCHWLSDIPTHAHTAAQHCMLATRANNTIISMTSMTSVFILQTLNKACYHSARPQRQLLNTKNIILLTTKQNSPAMAQVQTTQFLTVHEGNLAVTLTSDFRLKSNSKYWSIK